MKLNKLWLHFPVIVIKNSLIQEWELLRTVLALFVEFSNSFDKHYLSILISWLVVPSKPSCVNKEFENFSVNFPPEYWACQWNKNSIAHLNSASIIILLILLNFEIIVGNFFFLLIPLYTLLYKFLSKCLPLFMC